MCGVGEDGGGQKIKKMVLREDGGGGGGGGGQSLLKANSRAVMAAGVFNVNERTKGQRRRRLQSGEIIQAHAITTFSLHAPPPFDVGAAALIGKVLNTLPAEIRWPRSVSFDESATTKEAILLTTHSFWYSFVSLCLPHLLEERDELLRLMALQYAKLTLSVVGDVRDIFFDHLPALVAHAVLAALRRHGALGPKDQPQQVGNAAAGTFRHLIGLFGGRVPSADKLRLHMRFAEKSDRDPSSPTAESGGRSSSSSSPPRRAKQELFTVPWSYEPTPGPPVPPLAPQVILPLPTVEIARPPPPKSASSRESAAADAAPAEGMLPMLFGGTRIGTAVSGGGTEGGGSRGGGGGGVKGLARAASRWAPMKTLIRANTSIVEVQQTRAKQSSSTGDLHYRSQAYRPPKVPVDVRRRSPLVAIYTGVPPAEVLEAAQLPPMQPPSRSGFNVGSQLTRSRSLVRQSVPGYGGRSRLGGAASFQSINVSGGKGLAARGVPRVETLESERKQEEMTEKLFNAAMDSKKDEIDRVRDAKLGLSRSKLADYALELAEKRLKTEAERLSVQY